MSCKAHGKSGRQRAIRVGKRLHDRRGTPSSPTRAIFGTLYITNRKSNGLNTQQAKLSILHIALLYLLSVYHTPTSLSRIKFDIYLQTCHNSPPLPKADPYLHTPSYPWAATAKQGALAWSPTGPRPPQRGLPLVTGDDLYVVFSGVSGAGEMICFCCHPSFPPKTKIGSTRRLNPTITSDRTVIDMSSASGMPTASASSGTGLTSCTSMT